MAEQSAYAPIVLFAYNRPEHVRQLLESLNRNPEAKDSDLIVFCDGPKEGASQEMIDRINKTRETIRQTANCKSLTMHIAEENRGLAPSVIAGMNTVFEMYDRAIVLEDDLLLSEHFLRYMNDALEVYAKNPKVACISGYVEPHRKALPETFFLRGADCWGWATWKRAWAVFEPDGQLLLKRLLDSGEARHLCFDDNYDYVTMLKDQIAGRNSSWAVRWLVSAYLADMYCLYPNIPLDLNNGLDGSGTHCGAQKKAERQLAVQPVTVVNQAVEESAEGYQAYCSYFNQTQARGGFWKKVKRKLLRLKMLYLEKYLDA